MGYLLNVILLFLAFVIYRAIFFIQPFTSPVYINRNCHIIQGRSGMEDGVDFGKYFIGSSRNLKALFNPHSSSSENQGEICILDIEKGIFNTLDIQGLPKSYVLKPHGINLYDNKTIYVINHSDEAGGEKVEVIDVSILNDQVVLKHKKTLNFNEEFLNMFNSLYVLNDDTNEFYITSWLDHPIKEKDIFRDYNQILDLVKNLFYYKRNYAYYCKGIDQDSKPKCKRLDNTAGLQNNGIYFDKQTNKLYVADSPDRLIRVYNVDKQDKSQVNLIKQIKLDYTPDNLHYDANSGKIYIGSLGPMSKALKLINHMKNNTEFNAADFGWFNGAASLDTRNDDMYKVEIMQDNLMAGTSNAVVVGNKIVLSSMIDNGVMICDK